MLVKYLGSLPSTGRKESWQDKAPVFAAGVTDITFKKGTDPQAMVGIGLSEPLEWNEENVLYINMLKEILQIKLIEVIREKLSGVYSPQIMLNLDKYPKPEFMMGILFGCSPKTTNKLTKAVFGEIKTILKNGPTAEDLTKAKEALIRSRETDLEKNSFWASKIESICFQDANPSNILNFKERVNAVTSDDLKDAANRFFKIDHYVRVVLMPEGVVKK
jgi:zinc protease